MPRGRHRAVPPVRRPLAQPLVGLVIAGTMLGGPLLVAAIPNDTPPPDVALPSPTASVVTPTLSAAALAARDEVQASRGEARSTPTMSAPAEPSSTPEPSPEPSVEETTAEPTPTEPPPVVGQMWATRSVNVRAGASADTERIGYLGAAATVDVTGTTEDGWAQVVVDGRVGWVNGAYLADSEPEPEPEPEPEADSAPAPASDASCSISAGIESNLSSNARAVYRAVCAAYGGSVSSFGGYRPGDGGDHGSGNAVDVMVSGAAGWEIARYLQSRAGELGITYIIYEQQIWMVGDSGWEWMEDRGSVTANHYDHVHVSVR